MALLPVICDSCNAVWGAERIIAGSGAINIRMTGNTVSPCPNCGGVGSIPDGVYDLQEDTLTVVESSGASAGQLQEIIGLLESLRDGQRSTPEVIAEVDSTVPDLVPTVERALGNPAWIAVLIAILSLYLQMSAPSPPTAEQIGESIRNRPVPTIDAGPSVAKARSAGNSTNPKQAKRPPGRHGAAKNGKTRKRR